MLPLESEERTSLLTSVCVCDGINIFKEDETLWISQNMSCYNWNAVKISGRDIISVNSQLKREPKLHFGRNQKMISISFKSF